MTLALRDAWQMARERDPAFLEELMEHSKFNYQTSTLEVSNEAMATLVVRWPKKGRIRGLGDVVHTLLKPIVGIADSVLGTDLKNCPNCEDRRQALNDQFPLPS